MGFLSDLLDDFIERGNEGRPWGQHFEKRNAKLVDLYQRMYYDFGLKAPRDFREGERVPMSVGYIGDYLTNFEIRGNILSPDNFLTRGWGKPISQTRT